MTNSMQRTMWIWKAMIQRCANPNSKQYKDYGARGIKVDCRWLASFENFVADMGEKPDGLTLDRRDNDDGYSKENCRWVGRIAQNLNKRLYKSNHFGIAGIEIRDDYFCKRRARSGQSFRVRLRSEGKIVVNKTTNDFFEACCIRKSAENTYHKSFTTN